MNGISKETPSTPPRFIPAWKNALTHSAFRIQLVAALAAFILAQQLNAVVMDYAHARGGVELPDPILAAIGPMDVRWGVFGLLWGSLLLSIITFAFDPLHLVKGIQAASLCMALRAIALLVTPFAAPADIIPLRDPIVANLGIGRYIVNDLFFSGHTSTMFILFLLSRKTWMRALLLAATILVAAGAMLQHVHYTVDCLSAPFYAYGAYRLVFTAHEWAAKRKTDAQ